MFVRVAQLHHHKRHGHGGVDRYLGGLLLGIHLLAAIARLGHVCLGHPEHLDIHPGFQDHVAGPLGRGQFDAHLDRHTRQRVPQGSRHLGWVSGDAVRTGDTAAKAAAG